MNSLSRSSKMGIQSYATAEEWDPWRPHNVAAFSLVALCSVAYLGHVLVNRSEHARRLQRARMLSAELVNEAEKEEGAKPLEKHGKMGSASGINNGGGISATPHLSSTSKRGKREKRAKGTSVLATISGSLPASTGTGPVVTRSIATQTDPTSLSPLLDRTSSHGDDIALSRFTDGDGSEVGFSGSSPSVARINASLEPPPTASTSTSRDASVSGRSFSTDASSSETSALMRRRSSSGATSLSVASATGLMPLTDVNELHFTTPPNSSTRRSRRAKMKEREVVSRKEVVGLPKTLPHRHSSLPVPPVSRSNTIKALSSTAPTKEAYWAQDPIGGGPVVPSGMVRPASRPASALSHRSGLSSKSGDKQPASQPVNRQPDEGPSMHVRAASAAPNSPQQPPIPIITALPFSPPISPSPHRSHSNGSHNFSMPSSPSPSHSARGPPAYTAASSYDAIAAAQQAAMLIASQQALFQNQAAALQHHQTHTGQLPRSPLNGGNFFQPHPMIQMAYGAHPNYGMPQLHQQPAMMAPPLLSHSRHASSMSLASDAANGETKESEKLREQLHRLRERSKKVEIETERKSKELEIARWRLQCVEVERKQEEQQTQEAICFFVERAEAAERRVKELETRLGIPGEPLVLTTEDGIAPERLESDILFQEHIRSPKPTSAAALAGLERLDFTAAGSPSLTRGGSPALSPARASTSLFGSPPNRTLPSPSLSSGGSYHRRNRRGGRKYSQNKDRTSGHAMLRASSAPGSATEEYHSDSDDLVIMLQSPSLETNTTFALPPLANSEVRLGLGIHSTTSSEAGDEVETEAEEDTEALI